MVTQLEPFVHQVGGHSSMLCLDEGTICKPMVTRELRFYQTLPEPVRKFTPAFYGIIQVRIEQEEEGYVTLVAKPPEFYRPKSVTPKISRIRLRRSGSIEIEGDREEVFETDEEERHPCGVTRTRRISASHNPWSLRCHRDNLRAIIGSDTKNHCQNFILLENLTSRLVLPCVLDLKMGTRQYGDLATPAKRHSKMSKVANTTSGRLGLRLGGMQVYQVSSKKYLCRNKFHGRELTVSGFERTLYQFLHNGHRIRTDIISPLIKRLRELASILEQQEAFRFYTSSLLLLYDGECYESRRNSRGSTGSGEHAVGEVCHEAFSHAKYDFSESGNMLGRSFSADTMSYVKRGQLIERSHSLEPNYDEVSGTGQVDSAEQQHQASSVAISGLQQEPYVDVRIIDFAHSTHKGLGDPIQYTGPDQGFLFGLENLITMLKNIQSLN